MSYRVTYPCGNGTTLCREEFETLEEANVSAGVRRQQLKRWAGAGLADADAWKRVTVQEVKPWG